MIDKFSQALTLMREAFEDARTGSAYLPCLDLAAQVDGAQQVINAAAAVQALRVAQYAGREEEQDGTGPGSRSTTVSAMSVSSPRTASGRRWRWARSQPAARSAPLRRWPPGFR